MTEYIAQSQRKTVSIKGMRKHKKRDELILACIKSGNEVIGGEKSMGSIQWQRHGEYGEWGRVVEGE